MKECVNGIKWEFEVEGGNAMITSVSRSIVGDVDIPETLGGVKVACVTYGAFNNCSKLRSVTIPDGLLSTVNGFEELATSGISSEAFRGCSSLCAIHISKRNPAYKSVNGLLLTKGGEKVVAAPPGLMVATLPPGVTKIGQSAFAGCRKLKKVTMPNGVLEIEWNAFDGCCELEGVTIPDTVMVIRQDAFRGCRKFKSVTLPVSLKEIEPGVFSCCDGLREILVASRNPRFKSIDGMLLEKNAKIRDCMGERRKGDTLRAVPGGLTSVTVPDGVTHIDMCAFGGCSRVKNVVIPQSVTCIDWEAFRGCSALESMIIPDSVTEIGDGAFTECTKMKNLTIPASVTKVGRCAFRKCKIESVTFLPGVKSIYASMFARCQLKSVTIPDSVTSIGTCAFKGCTGLESVTIPRKVKKIGDRAFNQCSDLKKVTMPVSLKGKGIGRDVFPTGVKIDYVN